MRRFSANLGFLWADLPLDMAIRRAAAAGFAAVECHWPYDQDLQKIRSALADTGLPLISLNTRRGDVASGENGLAALPGRQAEARAAIDEAVDWAAALNARAVHVMAGAVEHDAGDHTAAVLRDNLDYACQRAAAHDKTILIEPLNPADAPGYFLTSCDQAADIIAAVAAPQLKMMFDCYHVARIEGEVTPHFDRHAHLIGHVQFAGVPHRGRPDQGDVDYAAVFSHLQQQGYDGFLGAEYRPGGETDETLEWMPLLS